MTVMAKKLEAELRCDVLVVGAGLAGLRAARDCAAAGLRVLVAVKGTLCSGASFYPLTDGLGSQLPMDEADKPVYLEEVLESGAGMADPALVQILIDSIEPEIDRLPGIGIRQGGFVNSGRPALPKARASWRTGTAGRRFAAGRGKFLPDWTM